MTVDIDVERGVAHTHRRDMHLDRLDVVRVHAATIVTESFGKIDDRS